MADPVWLTKATEYIGTAEVSGKKHNPKIVELWSLAKVPNKVTDDETPWCAAFVSAMLEISGFVSAQTGWARAYLDWGKSIAIPVRGCIVVFSRGKNMGHVGFVVGRDKNGNLMVLGGNQGDAVNIKPFAVSRVIGYRWPRDMLIPNEPLPIITSSGRLSTNEA